jgi:uncharacterized membrane protein
MVYSKVKLFGHPIHPMLVAYPIAFYTATLVGFIIYAVMDDHVWLRLTVAANTAGVVMALLAAVPGFIDWAVGIPRGTRAKVHGLRHMFLNVGSLALFAISLLVYLDEWTETSATGATLGIILAGAGVLFTIAAGFHGWMLIQDDHVGVRLTPEQELLEPGPPRVDG